MNKNLIALLLVLPILCSTAPTFATVIPVSSLANDGSGSLREAISLAQDGDTIEMNLRGIILLDSQLVITKDLYIKGFGPDTSAIDGQSKDRHFFVNDTSSLEISGFTLQNGDFSSTINSSTRPGGGFPDGGSIKLSGNLKGHNLIFSHNRATYGGAISIGNSQAEMSMVQMENVAFIYNRAQASDNNPQNIDETGGAIHQFGLSGGGTRFIGRNCTFSHNTAMQSGGAFWTVGDIAGGTEALFTHCTFAFNESERGAGINNFQFSAVLFDRCLFGKNTGRIDQDVRGSVVSRGYNILEIVGPNTEWNYDNDSTDLLGVATNVADLAYLGVLPTHPLGCNSPAINGVAIPANNLLVDQRGQVRIGLPDIGSHEQNADFDNRVYSLTDRGAGSLRLAIELACPGDTISMDQMAGSIRLESSLIIEKDLTIFGNPNARISLNGGDSLRIMDIGHVTCELRWLNFQHGHPEEYGGGAIRNAGMLDISNCAFFDNEAVSGGAIANYGVAPGVDQKVEARITNSIFHRNRANTLDGGAIDNRKIDLDASVELINCTLTENTAVNKGGGLRTVGANCQIGNSIFAFNTATEGGNEISSDGTPGNTLSLGTNLILDSLGAKIIYSPVGLVDLIGVAPLLDPLGNYEGPTLSRRLQAGSPAIDAGNDLLSEGTDQRGFQRIFGSSVDIGAYEYNPATSLDLTPKDQWLLSYPNPVVDSWNIEIHPNFPNQKPKLRMFDLSGKLIHSSLLQTGLNTISLDKLKEGIYFWQVETHSGKIILR